MGRPRKNKTEDFFVANNHKEKHGLSHVLVPFFYKITCKVQIGNNDKGEPIYGTTGQTIHESQKKDFDVIHSEQLTIPLPDLCPECRMLGIPKIDKKSNRFDYHARAVSPYSTRPAHKIPVNRSDDYRLTYDHKVDDKLQKCIIATFDSTSFLFKPNSNKINELHKHFFPYCAKWMEKLASKA